ncbi:hypothetical protein [Vibrio crassostreae]|uniref:hypothetical protein n=1 Tax=Vibrio crassostreae TaxID=246167 RepID=UPI001B3009B0|nr:hypothetical protein [Vibrio crassostreae]
MSNTEPCIVYNAIKTPDGTILESLHIHDYKTHLDKNGEEYMVDGGTAYTRRNSNKEPFEELTVTTEAPHEVQREYWSWGTYGKNGDQPLRFVKLKDMEHDHIAAVVNTQRINAARRSAMIKELFYRATNL